MKRILSTVILFLLVLTTLTSCSGDAYSFEKSIDEIKSIEIVSAENSLEFTIIKTLSEGEKESFIEQFKKIKFYQYFGDPSRVYGNTIKVEYSNGDYEMICSYTAEYVKNGNVHFLFKRCDEEEFNELLDNFFQ